MQDNNSPQKKPFLVGCNPIVFIFVIGFVFFTISASIPRLNNLIARYALCPTATDAYFKETSGGSVDKLGVYQDVSTKVVTLYCEYDNAPIKEVDNDIVVMTGFAVSAGLGVLVGLLIYSIMILKAKSLR